MKKTESSIDVNQARLTQALEEYYTALESSQPLSREQLLAKYSDVADELICCLDSLEFVNNIAPELGQEQVTEASSSTSTPQRALLGDFRIERQIGRGGMGVVYEAEQLSLGRRVALKVLPFAAMLDDRQLQRFQNEAKAAALLQHPNIVPVHGIGVERGMHYYAMQLIDGTTLAEMIAGLKELNDSPTSESGSVQLRGATPSADQVASAPDASPDTQPVAALSTDYLQNRGRFYRSAARIAQQAAEALHHAHEAGIVHRDIKPSNLLVDSRGKVWVADFGLAQFHTEQTLTASGDLVGTLRYMSPERLETGGVSDHRCDVYGLGITLYEIVVGRQAFAGDNRERIIRSVLNDPLAAPRKTDSRIPVDLETIIQKATAKTADSRYSSAAEMAEDLWRFIESKPVRARRASRTELLRLWARRNPTIAALVATVACLLLALAIGSTAFGIHALGVSRREQAMLTETATRLYVSEIRRAQTLIEQGDVVAGEEMLLRYVPSSATSESDVRGFEWFYLWDQCHRSAPARILRHGLPGHQVVYSPDGNRLITGIWSGSLHIWDRATGAKLFQVDGGAQHRLQVLGLGFINNGSEIVTATHDCTIGRWDLGAKAEIWFMQSPEPQPLQDASVACKRKLIAVSHGNSSHEFDSNDLGTVVVWDIESRKPIARFEEIPGCPFVEFSPDELRLIMTGFDGVVRVAETSTWTVQRSIKAHDSPIWSVAFTADGRILATGSAIRHRKVVGGAISLWDTGTWQLRETLHAHTDVVRCMAFSPDGSRLVSGSEDGELALWSVAKDEPSGLIAAFRGHSYTVKCVAFSPDGQEFSSISGDNTCRVWERDEVEKRALGPTSFGQSKDTKVTAALADNDTAVCLSGYSSNSVLIRDVISGDLRHEIPLEDATFTDLAVSPDQKSLAVAGGTFPVQPDRPGDFRLFDVASGEQRRRFETTHPFTCRGIEFSADGQLLVAACWKHLIAWDVGTGERLAEFGPMDNTIKCVSAHPRQPLVACGTTGGIVYLFDLSTLTLVRSEPTERGTIEGIDFSPDGRYFATGGAEQQIKLWDAETFRLVRRFRKTGNWVMHVRFSPDGRRVLSGCMDGSLYLSEVTTGEHLLQLPVEQTWIANGEFSRDGSFIAAAGRKVHIWRCADRWRELQRLSVESLQPVCVE